MTYQLQGLLHLWMPVGVGFAIAMPSDVAQFTLDISQQALKLDIVADRVSTRPRVAFLPLLGGISCNLHESGMEHAQRELQLSRQHWFTATRTR